MRNFFVASKYDPQFVIFKQDFRDVWKNVKDSELLKWIPKLMEGLGKKHMTLDMNEEPTLTTRLTRVIEDKLKKEITEG